MPMNRSWKVGRQMIQGYAGVMVQIGWRLSTSFSFFFFRIKFSEKIWVIDRHREVWNVRNVS